MIPELASLKLTVEGRIATLEFNHGKANEMGSRELSDIEA